MPIETHDKHSPLEKRAAAPFTKVYDRLILLGLPPRLVLLYGVLRQQADRDRKVQATHDMLAAKIGIRTRRQVFGLLCQLRDLRLVEWQRGRDLNTYWVYEIDVAWLSAWKDRQ